MRGWYSKVGSLLETLLINNSARIFKNEVRALGIGLLRNIDLIALMTKQIKPQLIVLEYLKTRHSIFLQKKLANEFLNILAY